MPKVWLRYNLENGLVDVTTVECWDGIPVEMNNSLYRQIRAAEKKYWNFQTKLNKWYDEAADGKLGRINDAK